jgi:hypothetical protein
VLVSTIVDKEMVMGGLQGREGRGKSHVELRFLSQRHARRGSALYEPLLYKKSPPESRSPRRRNLLLSQAVPAAL